MPNIKVQVPKFRKTKRFETYEREVQTWQDVTDIPKEKQACILLLEFPDEDADGDISLREQVYESGVSREQLNKADGSGVDVLFEFLRRKYGKDDLLDILDRYKNFRDYTKKDESMTDYIYNFDFKYNRIKSKGVKLPEEILAFELISKAGVSKEEEKLIMTGLDLAKREQMYDDAKKALRKFKGERYDTGISDGSGSSGIKVEPTFLTGDGRFRNRGRGRGRGRGQWRQRDWGSGDLTSSGQWYSGRGSDRHNWRGGGTPHTQFDSKGNGSLPVPGNDHDLIDRSGRPVNKKDKNGEYILCSSCGSYRHLVDSCEDNNKMINNKDRYGKLMLCAGCGSFRHFVANCRYKYEKVNIADGIGHMGYEHPPQVLLDDYDQVFLTNVVLFTGTDQNHDLTRESLDSALLDSCCTSNVCGEFWFDHYISSLSYDERKQIVKNPSRRVFQFGGETLVPSTGVCVIPAVFGKKKVNLVVDTVKSDVPLLLSRTCLKKLGSKVDYVTDTADILGQKLSLSFTASGHHCVSILPEKTEQVHIVLNQLSSDDQYKSILKLHRQFAHPPDDKLTSLLKEAGVWEDIFADYLKTIRSKCSVCRQRAPVPPRPVVGFSMAKRFNEVVAMDLKVLECQGGYILYLIDVYSRYTQAVYIRRKLATEVIHSIMRYWIGIFGVMQAVYSDNGGEFNNDELRNVASILNVNVHTTAAECPFQNGLCERIHAVTDMILAKLKAQYPRTPFDVLLQWACMARNSLQMWNGFSSHQLVFGTSPNLPNILTDNLPALEGKTQSEVFANHLNVLRDARKAFIESESDEKIRRALRSKVRASEQVFKVGDPVYYKRAKYDYWLGPARVVCQDGKVIYVRHGGEFYRVSPNRLLLAGTELQSGKVNVEVDDAKDTVDKSIHYTDPVMIEDDSEDDLIGNIDEEAYDRTPVTPVVDQLHHIDDQPVQPVTTVDPVLPVVNSQQQDNNRPEDTVRRSLRVFNKEQGASVFAEDVFIVTLPRNRHNDADCLEAKQVELDKLEDFGVYEVVEDHGQQCISTRWILWEKGEKKEVRARLVARGFEEDLEADIDSPTVCRSTMRMMLAIVAARHWKIKAIDIKSAFLQGKALQRDVFLKPPKEAKVETGSVWKLKRCLYGLNDAARKFYDSVVAELQNLRCQRSNYDPSLFSRVDNGVCSGVLVSHIDDFMHAGDQQFDDDITKKLCKRFVAGKNSDSEFKYTGYQITQVDSGIVVNQSEYMDSISPILLSAERELQKSQSLNSVETTQYRSLVGCLNWLVQGTRPDLAFQLVDFSTKFKNCTVSDLVQLNKALRSAKSSKCEVKLSDIGTVNEWKLVTYTDASFANLSNGTGSCIGYIVFLVGKNSRCCPLVWKSGRAKRVVKSTIAAEMMALLEGVEESIYLKTMILDVLKVKNDLLPIIAIVDHKGLCEAIHSTHLTEDKRLRIDVASIKESLSNKDIQEVKWCVTSEQLADCLTKKGADGRKLLTVMQSGVLNMKF